MEVGSDLIVGYLFVAMLVIVPLWRLLPSYGFTKYYALFAIVPAFAVILLWIMAFKEDLEKK